MRIFLQALALSFFGHVIFFSMFIVEDMEFSGRNQKVSLTMFPAGAWKSGRVEATTSSNPDIVDPKIVELAEMRILMDSPKLEAHRRAVLWEEEVITKVPEPDILKWLMWSFRREKPDYGSLMGNLPPTLEERIFSDDELLKIEESIKGYPSRKQAHEIVSSFGSRKLVFSPLPVMQEDKTADDVAPVKVRIGVSVSGRVLHAIPEEGLEDEMLINQVLRNVRKWRFEPVSGFDGIETPEKLEWGWMTVPWQKAPETGRMRDADNGRDMEEQ